MPLALMTLEESRIYLRRLRERARSSTSSEELSQILLLDAPLVLDRGHHAGAPSIPLVYGSPSELRAHGDALVDVVLRNPSFQLIPGNDSQLYVIRLHWRSLAENPALSWWLCANDPGLAWLVASYYAQSDGGSPVTTLLCTTPPVLTDVSDLFELAQVAVDAFLPGAARMPPLPEPSARNHEPAWVSWSYSFDRWMDERVDETDSFFTDAAVKADFLCSIQMAIAQHDQGGYHLTEAFESVFRGALADNAFAAILTQCLPAYLSVVNQAYARMGKPMPQHLLSKVLP